MNRSEELQPKGAVATAAAPRLEGGLAMDNFSYDNKIVKWFIYATMLWGIVGMLAGILAALQLTFPALNFNTAATTFGRVRPVHTNAVIFAFVGNGIFLGVYYSLQRLCKARMYSDTLSKITSGAGKQSSYSRLSPCWRV
jgi:cytochrome c oxidase cbb3-type subunit I/II